MPLYFVDPVHHAIGLSHSGWRGTVGKIGKVTVEKMHQEFGSDPAELLTAIGPSICQDCYEVGEEVIAEFAAAFREEHHPALFYKKENGKYQLDLWEANRIVLREAGVPETGISVTDICTHCNPELLFSLRTSADRRGNLCAFLCLKEEGR